MNVPVKEYLALLGEYLRPQRRRVAVLVALLFVTIGLQAVNPQLIRIFIDGATADASSDRLTAIAITFIVIAVVTLLAVLALGGGAVALLRRESGAS